MAEQKLEVVDLPVADLVPNPRNARTHSEAQIEELARLIEAYGWTNPILIDERKGIIAGHGRRLAALRLGRETVPTIRREGLTPEQLRGLIIADNKAALNAGWDFALLSLELAELDSGAFDMSLTGFSDAELEQIATWAPMLGAGNGSGAGAASGGPGGQSGQLSERFMLPPFSTLNAREGWWQARKAQWIALGIKSEIGRGGNLIGRSPQELFCHMTGIAYDQARQIVENAIAAEGEAFDLEALIARHNALLGRDGPGSDFSRSGAVVTNGPGGLKARLMQARGYA